MTREPQALGGERILVVEPRSSGHLLVFVAQLVARLGDRNTVIVLTTPEVAASAEYAEHLGPVAHQAEIVELPPLSPREVSAWAARHDVDRVIVPHADPVLFGWLRACIRPGRARVRLLVMRDPRWERPAPLLRRLKGMVKVLGATLVGLAPRTDVLWLREPRFESRRANFVVDPFLCGLSEIEVGRRAGVLRSELELESSVFWFGVTGAITGRKNVSMIVDALVQLRASGWRQPAGLALIGPVVDLGDMDKDSVAAALRAADVECRIVDRLLSNDEMNVVVKALDCVVMAYSSHSPNSTLGKAHALGTRVVAAGPPSVQRFASRLDAGFTSELTVEDLARILRSAAERSDEPPAHFGDGAASFVRQLAGVPE